MTFLLNIFKAYTTIIFEVTVGNADRKVRKMKVGAQIIARRGYEKPAAQTPPQKSLSWH